MKDKTEKQRITELEQRISEKTAELETAKQRLQQEIIEKEVLLREVHHRVKNNFAVIHSLLSLQSQQIEDQKLRALFKESAERVQSMAMVHKQLYQSADLASVDFKGYIRSLARNLYFSYAAEPEKVDLQLRIEDISLGVDQAIPCGLIVNELISNALKYAFPKEKEGQGFIRISLGRKDKGEIELKVKDNGAGLPEDLDIHASPTLGLQLVSMLAEEQLEGKLDVSRTGGTEIRILFGEQKETD